MTPPPPTPHPPLSDAGQEALECTAELLRAATHDYWRENARATRAEAKRDAALAEVKRLRELLERAQKNIKHHYRNWHRDARAALATPSEPQAEDAR